jgi:hypothetical protein
MQKAYAHIQDKKLKKEERVELFEKLAWVDGTFTSVRSWN